MLSCFSLYYLFNCLIAKFFNTYKQYTSAYTYIHMYTHIKWEKKQFLK